MKWYWRILIIIGLIVIGSFVMTILEINSNWGYLWGFIVFMFDLAIERFCFKKPIKSTILPFLKAIWGNVWPTAKQKEPTEFPPQEELNSKLNEHLAWVKSMAGAYVFWEKDRYEVWRDEGMFYIAIPNKETGSVFCSTSAGRVLNMARDTLKAERESILSNMQSMVNVADSLAKAWLHVSGYLKPEPLSGDISEQSVILPKMDEIADPFAEDYAKSHSDRFAIIDKVPKRMFESMGIYYPNNGIGEWNGVKHDWKQNYKGITPSTVDETGKPLDDDLYKYVGYNLYNSNTDIYGPRLVFKNGEAYPLSYIKDKIKPEEFDKTLKRLFKKV